MLQIFISGKKTLKKKIALIKQALNEREDIMTEVSKKEINDVWESKEVTEIPKEYLIAPLGEEKKWNYTLENNHIILSDLKYNNTDKNIIVYDKYTVNGVEYQTKIRGNKFGSISFSNKKSLETIKFGDNIDFSEMISCSSMFSGCSNLRSVDLGTGFDTSNVVNINSMFSACTSLLSIDVSNFKFDNQYDAYNMFNDCTNLIEIKGLSTLITSKCININSILLGCRSLILECISSIKNWDISNVTNIRFAISGCTQLELLDVSGWNVLNVEAMDGIFSNCTNLKEIKGLEYWDTSKVINMNAMFANCSSLLSLDLSKWDTNNLNKMERLFSNCSSLTSVDVSSFNTSNVTNMNRVFEGCQSLTSLDLTSFDIHNVTSTSYMFNGCKKLTEIKVSRSKWIISDNCNISLMFTGCGVDHVTYVD